MFLLYFLLGTGAAGYTPQQLIVVNVHIHWDPEYSDVKLCQTIFLLNELRQLVAELTGSDKRSERTAGREKDGGDRHNKENSNSIPIIMCGDFNSLPRSGELLLLYFIIFNFYIFLSMASYTYISMISNSVYYMYIR